MRNYYTIETWTSTLKVDCGISVLMSMGSGTHLTTDTLWARSSVYNIKQVQKVQIEKKLELNSRNYEAQVLLLPCIAVKQYLKWDFLFSSEYLETGPVTGSRLCMCLRSLQCPVWDEFLAYSEPG